MEESAVQTSSTPVAVDDRRRHQRVPGPFDGVRLGLLETPLRIFDLSLGGCFVNALHEQEKGVICSLKIELPEEGWVTVKGETVYRRPDFGYAVRFIEMDDESRERLDRALRKLMGSSSSL